jgi:hypothetical protein
MQPQNESYFLSHLSPNTPENLISLLSEELRTKGHAAALRLVELQIYSRLQALSEYWISTRKNELRRKRIDWLSSLIRPFRFLPLLSGRLSILEIQIEEIDAATFFSTPLVRDALIELSLAQSFKKSLVCLHPDLLETSKIDPSFVFEDAGPEGAKCLLISGLGRVTKDFYPIKIPLLSHTPARWAEIVQKTTSLHEADKQA